jgi:trimeric autotransporter adhesin
MKITLRVAGVLILVAVLSSSVPAQEVRGTGTAGSIPLWLDPHRIGDSVISQGADDSLTVNSEAATGLILTTSNTSNGSTALIGNQTATTGGTFGVRGFTASQNGVAVAGYGVTLGVYGSASATGSGVVGVASASTGITFGVDGTSQSTSGIGVYGNSPNVGVEGVTQSCVDGTCTPTAGTAGTFVTASGGNVLAGFINSAGVWSPVFRVDSTGEGFFDGGTQTGGADFAESVAVAQGSHPYAPGDLLVLDTTSDRQLTLSTEPYSTLVAGIYSTKPGVLATTHKIDSPLPSAEVPLAIVGIVPCKVSAENGPIQRGDLLVTSSTPGYAMKGTDRSRMLGAVVGKAMEPLKNGKGTIHVLVSLQ